MNDKKLVISPSNLPVTPSLGTWISIWLLMNKLNCATWGYGVYWTLYILFMLAWLIRVQRQKLVDISSIIEAVDSEKRKVEFMQGGKKEREQ